MRLLTQNQIDFSLKKTDLIEIPACLNNSKYQTQPAEFRQYVRSSAAPEKKVRNQQVRAGIDNQCGVSLSIICTSSNENSRRGSALRVTLQFLVIIAKQTPQAPCLTLYLHPPFISDSRSAHLLIRNHDFHHSMDVDVVMLTYSIMWYL